jgi:hypothetical protein
MKDFNKFPTTQLVYNQMWQNVLWMITILALLQK